MLNKGPREYQDKLDTCMVNMEKMVRQLIPNFRFKVTDHSAPFLCEKFVHLEIITTI